MFSGKHQAKETHGRFKAVQRLLLSCQEARSYYVCSGDQLLFLTQEHLRKSTFVCLFHGFNHDWCAL